jgi:protein TonB
MADLTAELRKNWFIPVKDASRRGTVVVRLTVQKDGRITDVGLVQSSGVESFDTGALHAITASSPTGPLPAAYPDLQLPLTLTFYFNVPPKQREGTSEAPRPGREFG